MLSLQLEDKSCPFLICTPRLIERIMS
jgi:serine/threonine protein phosphatase PrpC